MAGGSMGAGSIDRLIPALLRRMQREEHLILICGSNQKHKDEQEIIAGVIEYLKKEKEKGGDNETNA